MKNKKRPLNLAMFHIIIGHLVYACMNGLSTKGTKDLRQVKFF